MGLVARILPRSLRRRVKRLIPWFRRVHCPICGGFEHAFKPFGVIPRPNAQCPTCGSLARHRLVWLFLQRRTDLFTRTGITLLHYAPEHCLAPRFAALPGVRYTTADLFDPNVMVKADITDPPFPDASFDALYCSHVLEHIPDDRLAMRRCLQLIKPDGWAVFLVPITAERTFEDPSITDPAERERLFGQVDHVRRYGPDFADRLRESGFDVTPVHAADVTDGRPARYAIPDGEAPLYFCRRR